MKNRVRQQFGSIVFDKRIKTWNFLWWENGKRRSKAIGTVHQFPTKTSAWRAAKALRQMLESTTGTISSNTPSVRALVEKYRAEKMPSRSDTRRTYEVWLRNHIIPKWGILLSQMCRHGLWNYGSNLCRWHLKARPTSVVCSVFFGTSRCGVAIYQCSAIRWRSSR